jgi:hypothetical protein
MLVEVKIKFQIMILKHHYRKLIIIYANIEFISQLKKFTIINIETSF